MEGEPSNDVPKPSSTRVEGVVPVKAEFLRPVVQRVALDGDNAVMRGMNKGAEREHNDIAKTGQRPSFEGEVNFLNHETIQKTKVVLKRKKEIIASIGWQPGGTESKRPRDEDEGQDKADTEKAVDPKEFTPPTAESAEAPPSTTTNSGTVQEKSDEPRDVRQKRLFSNKLVLSPLTTVGNLPFRRICKNFGADVTVSEMALSHNLNTTQKSEWSLLRRHECEDIFGIQIATSKPTDAAITAALIKEAGFSYDYIDINCGCPIDLMVQRGCGFGLWERKKRLEAVTKALIRYQDMPVTIKCRIGADMTAPTLHKQIAEYETWGASAVTIHGRSRKQRYSKLANWEYVNECAAITRLPVVGNGDVLSWEDVVEHRKHQPNVTSFMIGRGALIKPWVFSEIKNEQVRDISSSERLDMLRQFCNYGLIHWGADERGVSTTRRYLCEWLSFLCRYVPVGLLEQTPQRINDRPPFYIGRDDLETLMGSESVEDWIKISELLLGPAKDFKFTPKHKSNSYASVDPQGQQGTVEG